MAGHRGLPTWLWQRITAAYLGVYLIAALGFFIGFAPESYDAWQAIMTRPVYVIATGLFLLALLAHAWFGIKDVLIDYVHPLGLRLLALVLIGLLLTGYGLWGFWVLFVESVA